MANERCILVKIVAVKNVDAVRKVRKSQFSYKVRSIDNNYDEIVQSVHEDMEKVKILKGQDKL